MLTAQEARLLAEKNSSGFKKVVEVLQEIQKAAKKVIFLHLISFAIIMNLYMFLKS